MLVQIFDKTDDIKRTMTTKKFWCHYLGTDGNTPKRRNIELTNLSELLRIDNENVKTPLWFEVDQDDCNENIYFMYAQLSDKVAVFIPRSGIHGRDVKLMLSTDEQIDALHQQRLKEYLDEYPAMSEERKAKEAEYYQMYADEDKMKRDKYLGGLKNLQDYEGYLLGGHRWIDIAAIKAFEEIQSPSLHALQDLRRQALEEQERIEQQRKEERRQQREAEEQKKAAEQAREDAKLQKLVSLGMLPAKLTKMQRGTVLIGLDERGRYQVAGNKTVSCTVFELITEHGFTRMQKYTERYGKNGLELSKPRNYYDIYNDTLGYGYQVNGRMGALMIEGKKP